MPSLIGHVLKYSDTACVRSSRVSQCSRWQPVLCIIPYGLDCAEIGVAMGRYRTVVILPRILMSLSARVASFSSRISYDNPWAYEPDLSDVSSVSRLARVACCL